MELIYFKALVKKMRNAQRYYFKTRHFKDLATAKALEKQIDDILTTNLFTESV